MKIVDYKDIYNWSVQYLTGTSIKYQEDFHTVRLCDLVQRVRDMVDVADDEEYTRVTVKTDYGGICLRDKRKGREIGTKRQCRIRSGQLLVSKIDARNGAIGIVPADLAGGIVTGNFWVYAIRTASIRPKYLALVLTTSSFMALAEETSNGSTGRHYMQEGLFLSQHVPLPSVALQQKLVDEYEALVRESEQRKTQLQALRQSMFARLYELLGMHPASKRENNHNFCVYDYKDLCGWSVEKLKSDYSWRSSTYDVFSLGTCGDDSILYIHRGKSPRYSLMGRDLILNQKCVRWFDIDISYARKVDAQWVAGVSEELFTREGDLLINSTGEGTLGRSAVVRRCDEVGLPIDSHILVVRVNRSKLLAEFLCLLFNSEFVQRQIEFLKSATATSQTELGIASLQKINIVMPPISQQRKIVRELDGFRRKIALLENADDARKKARENFENAIFARG